MSHQPNSTLTAETTTGGGGGCGGAAGATSPPGADDTGALMSDSPDGADIGDPDFPHLTHRRGPHLQQQQQQHLLHHHHHHHGFENGQILADGGVGLMAGLGGPMVPPSQSPSGYRMMAHNRSGSTGHLPRMDHQGK